MLVPILGVLSSVACGAANPVGPTESSSIDTLVAGLRTHGATVIMGEVLPQQSNPFFSTNAKLLVVNGGSVSVFEYPSNAAAESDAARVSRDGSVVGSTSITWVGPPHFYKSGRLIVLHAGNSQAVLGPLEAVLGPPFAAPIAPIFATVRIVFLGATARRADLPASAQACLGGVGATHTHPSWRDFAGIPLQAVLPDRYEISFSDVPVGTRVSFRVNDQNACDEDPTGAVTRNVIVNDVRLAQNTTTPGNGEEPGFAFTITATGTISQ